MDISQNSVKEFILLAELSFLQSESAVETLPSQTSIVGRLLYMVIVYELT